MKTPISATFAAITTVYLANVTLSGGSAVERVESPDGRVAIECLMQTGGSPAYRMEYLGVALKDTSWIKPGKVMRDAAVLSHQRQTLRCPRLLGQRLRDDSYEDWD